IRYRISNRQIFMNANLLRLWLALALLPIVSPRALAEPLHLESIDWVLANSDRVVAGKVISVDEVLDRHNEKCEVLTVAVSKTLKGPHTNNVTFVSHPWLYNRYGKQWREDQIPLVFCLLKNDEKVVAVPANLHPWVLRDDGRLPDAILLGKSERQFTGSLD